MKRSYSLAVGFALLVPALIVVGFTIGEDSKPVSSPTPGVRSLVLSCCDSSTVGEPVLSAQSGSVGLAVESSGSAPGSRSDEVALQPASRADSPVSAKGDETGATGSIKGRLKSPYARVARGVVYIEKVDGRKFELPEENPVMDQKNKIFKPHLLPVLVGSTVDFPNTDDVRHSVYSRKNAAKDFNLGQYDVGTVKRVKFDQVGVTHLACNIHTEMSGFIIACQNPFFTMTNKKGNFEISDVPAGTWKLTFFHEKIKTATIDVTVGAGQETNVEFTKLKRRR